MIRIKNILVTTDLSPASYSALEYASWLEKKEKASVTLLYCVDNLPTVAYHTVDLTFDKFREEILTTERERMTVFSDPLKKMFSKTFKVVVMEGNAAQTIVEYARSNGTDIIVMSTHGRTGLEHVLLGSVSERVVRTAQCPVLTVKSKQSQKVIKRRSSRKNPANKISPVF